MHVIIQVEHGELHVRIANMEDVVRIAAAMSKELIARNAFWGMEVFEKIERYISSQLGYEMDGVRCPANGYTLAEAIDVVLKMSDQQIESLLQAAS